MTCEERISGLSAVLFLPADLGEDRLAGAPHLGLLVVVDLEQAVQALDDLHARLDPRGLHRDVGQVVDGDAGGDLDEERRLVSRREEALGDGAEERGVLRLQRVEEDVAAEVDAPWRQSLRDEVATRPVSDSMALVAATYATSMSRCSPPRYTRPNAPVILTSTTLMSAAFSASFAANAA